MKENNLGGRAGRKGEWALLLVLLVLILAVLFHRSVMPNQIIFANDGPLGANNANSLAMPSAFVSVWRDLNSVGGYSGSFLLPVTGVLLWILKPLAFAKLYVPLVFLLLGCSAGLFFRRLKLAPAACILGAIAMALNSEFFSTACWGIAIPATALAACFLALAAVTGDFQRVSWVRLALAGLAVGVCVMEAADVGAIFSVFVAAYIAYGTLTAPGALSKQLGIAVLRVGCVAAFALFMAAQTVIGMVETQIQGVAAAKQDAETKAMQWDAATEWSFPKSEVISLAVPGLFGYGISPREDHADDQYWGRVGQHVTWEEYLKNGQTGPAPGGFIRHTGTGFYAGIMIVLLGLWAAGQSLRREGSVFSLAQRKALWFWLGMFIVSLLLAFGRYAPFYRLFYALPYASAIRNPIKFMHTVNWALVVMFAYGVHGLVSRYLKSPVEKERSDLGPKLSFWRRINPTDRRWVLGCTAFFVLSLIGVIIYASSGKQLADHLGKVGFDPLTGKAIADQSVAAAVIFILRFGLALGVIVLLMSGLFSGWRARWGAVLLGAVLAGDLATADVPWIKYQDFAKKYASNPIIELLRDKPYEHRVEMLPFQPPPEAQDLTQLYLIEWHQVLFQYYNIQSLKVVQMSRVPEDIDAFQRALQNTATRTNLYLLARNWQLTNTRYLLGPSGYLNALNEALDPGAKRFRFLTNFEIAPKPGLTPRSLEDLTAVLQPNGRYAIFEFTGALPRVKLFSNWEINSNEDATLNKLTSESFDPLKTVIVASNVPPPSATSTNQDAGNVEFTSYDTKHIVLEAEAKTPAVLLFNDKYDPNWQVTVDGQRATLLRCNYIMRGVYMTPGRHKIDFRFVVSNKPLYFTLAAGTLGIVLLGFLAIGRVTGKTDNSALSAAADAPDKSKQG